nr:hypothetical protein [Tanacetum cinerariifolium]
VNPHVYISCIKQFWNTAVVKRSGDVTGLQALVDKKRIVITEEVVREILQLNDVEGVLCLPNKEIFAGLARMGYEKPSTKLTFYKAFFLTQWKFFIHTILHSLSAKKLYGMSLTNIADLSKHTTRYISPILTQKVFANMRRVGKGFSGVETPLFEKEVATDVVSPTPTSPSPSSPVIPSLPPHQPPCLPQPQDAEDDVENVFNQGRIIVDMDQDEGIKLVAAASIPIPAAKPKTLTITAAPAVSTRRRKGVVIKDPEEELPSDTTAETPKVKDKAKGILIEAPKPMKKKDQIEMDVKYARKLQEEINKEHKEAYKNIDWNAALDQVQSKEPQYIKRYHGMKKKPQTESEVRKNMIFYLKNTEGYKMDFFKGNKEEMEKEDEEIIKSINKTPAQKAAKRRKLSEEAQEADDLRKRLEIVQDKDNDVFVEATPLA